MTTCTLAGVPFAALGPVSWAQTEGARPYMREFEMPTAKAERVWGKRGAPVTLEIAPGGREPLRWRGLLIVDLRPGTRPDTLSVLVADRRWLWGRRNIVRDFNMRRRTGEARLVGETRIEVQPLAADAAYAAYSLDAGAPFAVERAIRSVFDELEPGNYDLSPVTRAALLESVSINARGDAAVEEVLGYAIGLGVTVEASGRVTIFDARSRAEEAMLVGRNPVVGSGWSGVADKSQSRPAAMNVLIEREVEVRFDFLEGERQTTTIRNDPHPPRKLENVLPVPDTSITIGGRVVSRGTWVNIDDYLEALRGQESGTMGQALGPITQRIIRVNWLAKWSYVVGTYATATSGQTDPTWQKRLDAIRKHWRQTFRLLPEWRAQIRGVRAYRASIVDVETGTRAPSEAYMDYVARPSALGLMRPLAYDRGTYGRQVSGWSEQLSSAQAAPAEVRVLDEEAGIIRVYLLPDPWGDVDALAPGNAENLPTWGCDGTIARLAQSTAVFGLWQAVALKEEFRLAMVLTLLQGAPNNNGRMHLERVTPDQAGQALGLSLGECAGPEWTVMLSSGVATARVAWLDGQAGVIEEAIYTGRRDGETQDPLASLLVNRAEVRALAVDAAARVYASLVDRSEGGFAVALDPGLRVVGSIAVVEHILDTKGRALSRVAIAPEPDPLPPYATIPEGMQRVVRRLVQP